MTREIFVKSVGGAAGLFELELSMRVIEKLILFSIVSQLTALILDRFEQQRESSP